MVLILEMESKGKNKLQEAREVRSYTTGYYHKFNLSSAGEVVESRLFDPNILVSWLELVEACSFGVLLYGFTL